MTDGGPAFPTHPNEGSFSYLSATPGMSLRDWFAGQALQGMMAGNWPQLKGVTQLFYAKVAYDYADAMLKQREG